MTRPSWVISFDQIAASIEAPFPAGQVNVFTGRCFASPLADGSGAVATTCPLAVAALSSVSASGFFLVRAMGLAFRVEVGSDSHLEPLTQVGVLDAGDPVPHPTVGRGELVPAGLTPSGGHGGV